MSISEQGFAMIRAMESGARDAASARSIAEIYATKLMVRHLNEVHGFGVRKLATHFGLKMVTVKKMIANDKTDED
jgi:hypothetical protein